jgi:TonB family protein
VKPVPRGFAAALAISLAAHAGLIVVPWSGASAGGRTPSTPVVIVARLLDADKPEMTTSEATAASPRSQPVGVTVPRPDSPIVSEQSSSISESTTPSGPDAARSIVASPVFQPSDSASGATPSLPDASEGRVSSSTSASESSSGLDRGPQPLDDIEPAFPAAAGTRGGTVTLRLVISDQGAVESIEVIGSSPPGLFDAAALAAFGHARFSPGLKAGVPVRSEVRYDVSFAPIGRGSSTSGRTY